MAPLFAGFLVFYTSAAVLVLEILAGRVLAPYVGQSLETFTGIIGTVLAGIALGSWYGGRVADRVDPRHLLGPMVLGGGAITLLTLPLVRLFGAGLQGGGVAAILILSVVGFFAPAAVLSAVNPTVVKLQLASLAETGRTVGRYSALSTVGALAGTFVTGFVLVAALPSQPIILAVGGSLVALGAGLWLRLRPARAGSPTAMLAVAAVAGALTLAVQSPCDLESAYFCARVETDPANASGRILMLDTLRHSYVDLDDPAHLEFSYTQMLADALGTLEPGQPLDTLHIGGGGFSMPRYLAATRPGGDNLVLELDPTLLQISRDELGLETGDGLRVDVGDARLSLARQPARRWDAVIGDAFGGLAVPWHLTTAEFVEEVQATLRPDGLYLINVIDYDELGFARAEAATLAAVFEHVAVMAEPDHFAPGDERGGNHVIVASDAPIDLAGIERSIADRGGAEVVLSGAELDAWIGDAQVLTDDFAPVDQLLTPA
jgi:spermidine synthase